MMNWDRIETLAFEVKRFGASAVAEVSGVKQARVSRFIKDQQVVTMGELDRIQNAVNQLKENEQA
jgi:plasmid maintenance system antidote protein VapI